MFVAREILEIGVEYSVAQEDVSAFERYMAMLKTYYMDYADKLEESPKKFELLGLNLLRLLSQNETAKFHTELELLDPSTIQENPYISCPVKLEQDIMEGSYRKVSNLWHNIIKIVVSWAILYTLCIVKLHFNILSFISR